MGIIYWKSSQRSLIVKTTRSNDGSTQIIFDSGSGRQSLKTRTHATIVHREFISNNEMRAGSLSTCSIDGHNKDTKAKLLPMVSTLKTCEPEEPKTLPSSLDDNKSEKKSKLSGKSELLRSSSSSISFSDEDTGIDKNCNPTNEQCERLTDRVLQWIGYTADKHQLQPHLLYKWRKNDSFNLSEITTSSIMIMKKKAINDMPSKISAKTFYQSCSFYDHSDDDDDDDDDDVVDDDGDGEDDNDDDDNGGDDDEKGTLSNVNNFQSDKIIYYYNSNDDSEKDRTFKENRILKQKQQLHIFMPRLEATEDYSLNESFK